MGLYARAMESLDTAISLAGRMPSSQSVLTQLRTSILRDRVRANLRRLESETDESRRQEILDAARLRAKKATTNYIHRLPSDVLLCIAEEGGLAVKMGMVCRDWREVVCSQPGLWSCLIVDNSKSMAKAKLWVERSNGMILELRIEQGFDVRGKGRELVSTLGCCLERVESLVIKNEKVVMMLDYLRSSFVNLKRLSVRQIDRSPRYHLSLDLGVLQQNRGPLRRLELENYSLDWSSLSPLTFQASFGRDDRPDSPFSTIDTLHLTDTWIASPISDPVSLLKLFPSMREVSLTRLSWDRPSPSSEEPPSFTHEVLRSYTEDGRIGSSSFERVNAPFLTSLVLRGHYSFDPSVQLLAPGLSGARSQLTYLDITHSVYDERLLLALAALSSLRFLNVSLCTFDDNFLIALQRKEGEEGLLPRLTALSMAGNSSISSAAVRDLVNSRLPAVLRLSRTGRVAPKKKPSSFLPTAPSQPDAVSLSPAADLPPSEPSRQDDLPMITWLNLDLCERIDLTAANILRRRVRFVSNSFGYNEERMRGKGEWAWDGDWSEHCGNGAENKCHLRQVEGRSRDLDAGFSRFISWISGSKDQWYVQHVCHERSAPDEEDVGWACTTQNSKSGRGAKTPRLA